MTMTEATVGKKLVLTEEQALEIITFMVSAAELCLHEPVYYGTFRLVDGASRLMGLMLENNPETSGEFFKAYKADIDANKTQMMWDKESYYDFLRRIPAAAATELKRVRELADEEGGAK
jgi:Family of unknown function (DUF6092)